MELIIKSNNIEEVLGRYLNDIGDDYDAYKGHIYRVLNFTLMMYAPKNDTELRRIELAAVYHDIGLWTDSFDYIGPSVMKFKDDQKESCDDRSIQEVSSMIENHHKLRRYSSGNSLTEYFRRADMVDLSLGLVKFGLDSRFIKEVKARFPNNGFHKRLTALSLRWFAKHPLNPLPMFRW